MMERIVRAVLEGNSPWETNRRFPVKDSSFVNTCELINKNYYNKLYRLDYQDVEVFKVANVQCTILTHVRNSMQIRRSERRYVSFSADIRSQIIYLVWSFLSPKAPQYNGVIQSIYYACLTHTVYDYRTHDLGDKRAQAYATALTEVISDKSVVPGGLVEIKGNSFSEIVYAAIYNCMKNGVNVAYDNVRCKDTLGNIGAHLKGLRSNNQLLHIAVDDDVMGLSFDDLLSL
jgi:hypothetical protein